MFVWVEGLMEGMMDGMVDLRMNGKIDECMDLLNDVLMYDECVDTWMYGRVDD
jgi:hypothetical protein